MGEYRIFPTLLSLLALSVPAVHCQAEAKERLMPHNQSSDNMTPSMADEQPRGFLPAGSLTAGEIADTLERHNVLRAGVTPKSSDMEYMSWDSDLADMAQIWAQRCRFEHGDPPNTSPYAETGQNIWAFTGSRDNPLPVSRATQYWYNEVEYYDYETRSCTPGKVCGHYTQVVWAATNKVGCGREFCPNVQQTNLRNAWFVVCNYAPRHIPERPPYSLGPACTQCASGIGQCYNGLCRPCSEHSERCVCEQQCQNCGQLNTRRCSCTCMDGWWGADCSKPCENTKKQCGANPGWYDASACSWATYIPLDCPLMCGLCKTGDRSVTCDPGARPTGGNDESDCGPEFTAFVYIGNELYAFQGTQVWRFGSNGELISDRSGEKARRYFKKLPQSPAGAFGFADGNVGFTKGGKIYVYSGTTLAAGYPKYLRSLGLPKNFEAAFHLSDEGRSGKTYFMKGDKIWGFDESTQDVDSGYPKPLADVFPHIKNGPSGAFINEEGKLHIVYGRKYVIITDDGTVSESNALANKYRIPGC